MLAVTAAATMPASPEHSLQSRQWSPSGVTMFRASTYVCSRSTILGLAGADMQVPVPAPLLMRGKSCVAKRVVSTKWTFKQVSDETSDDTIKSSPALSS